LPRSSTDLTNLAGWTLIGHQLDHNPNDGYTSLPTADGGLSSRAESSTSFTTALALPSTDQGGSVCVASFAGTAADFLGSLRGDMFLSA
jgi:hypothetical protein